MFLVPMSANYKYDISATGVSMAEAWQTTVSREMEENLHEGVCQLYRNTVVSYIVPEKPHSREKESPKYTYTEPKNVLSKKRSSTMG